MKVSQERATGEIEKDPVMLGRKKFKKRVRNEKS